MLQFARTELNSCSSLMSWWPIDYGCNGKRSFNMVWLTDFQSFEFKNFLQYHIQFNSNFSSQFIFKPENFSILESYLNFKFIWIYEAWKASESSTLKPN